jgi:ABC-type transport system involved in cytochrome bd biosynthesis fused ATPase/permease subunit
MRIQYFVPLPRLGVRFHAQHLNTGRSPAQINFPNQRKRQSQRI